MDERRLLVRDIITEAFDKNGSVNYVVKQDSKRIGRIGSLVDYSYNICDRFGDIVVNEDQTAASLISLPHIKKDFLFSLRQDFALIRKSIGVARLSTVLKREKAIKKYHPTTPFCHLWYIGVARNYQNKGIGTQLLQTIIKKYDRLALPIYLETSMEDNVPWYQKNGFEVFNELNDFGFTIYMMRRDREKMD